MYIKGFDKDLKCRGYQFKVGKVYDTGYTDNLECCTKTVFHFCDNLQNVNEYYDVQNEDNRFCEIEVLGELVKDNNKCGSNRIKIVREIKGEELKRLKMLINGNTGVFNTGSDNIGDCNTGDNNTGDNNTGNYNAGNRNTGDFNTGNRNTGYRNTGNRNTGDNNTGDNNTGDYNAGHYNAGNCNTGYRNTGNCNTGSYNAGKYNTGHYNAGICNAGNYNTGRCNTGDYNTGDNNTGGWNATDYETGFFNTKESTVRIFNKQSNLTRSEFKDKYGCVFNGFVLVEWITYSNEEKKADLLKQCLGGYLKEYTIKEASLKWYQKLTKSEKALLFSIPNFDCDIFEEITGLDTRNDFEKYKPKN